MIELMAAIENAFSHINIISWIDLAFGIARHGRLQRIEWRDESGYPLESLLRRYKIHVYGRGVRIEIERDAEGNKRRTYRKWMFVNHKQASWAEYVLLRGGFALESVIDPRNVTWAANHSGAPAPWMAGKKATATPVEAFSDLLAGALGVSGESPRRQPRVRRERKERYR